jgi:ABC-type amino acid transport substrate-binding protein
VTTHHHLHKDASSLGVPHQLKVVAISNTTAETYPEQVGIHPILVNHGEEAMPYLQNKKADAFVYDVPSLRYLAKEHLTSNFHITTLEEAPVQRYAFALPEKHMDIVAFHPDSDFGPEHDDHPMINRTIVEGVSAKYIENIRT